MKNSNKKRITLLLAAALGVTTIGLGATALRANADETTTTTTASTYALTDVFTSDDSGVIGSEKRNENDEAETLKFTLAEGQNVRFQRNLALKWFGADTDGEGNKSVSAKYFTLKFALADLNFETLTFKMESESSIANKDSKAVNSVKLTAEGGKVYASVINGTTEGDKKEVSIVADQDVTLALAAPETDVYGNFDVTLDGVVIGTFKNIGANYADFTSDKMIPLTVSATFPETAATDETEETVVSTALYVTELNNQSFTNVTEKTAGGTKVVSDTTPPVLVVNEDIPDGFLLGTSFSFSFEAIDVLPSSVTTTETYYQWNPADAEPNYVGKKSSPYYFDTTYYYSVDDEGVETYYKTAEDAEKAVGAGNYKTTSVYQKYQKEYISYKLSIADSTFKDTRKDEDGDGEYETGSDARGIYELAWYVGEKAVESKNGVDYIIMTREALGEEKGPTYKYTALDKENKINVEDSSEEYQNQKQAFEEDLQAAADEAVAGSNSYIYFPSLSWLIEDNNGYRNLEFTISYKSPSSTSTKTSTDLAYNGLRLSTSDEGWYEFKVFAADKAGNAMKYYLDGELVEVTSSNIWDIEEIPSFTYKISYNGMSVDTDDDDADERLDFETLDDSYTFSDVTIVGATTKKSNYALYKVDWEKYEGAQIAPETLASISFADIKAAVEGKVPADGDYFALYLEAYITKLAAKAGVTVDSIKDCFIPIKEYNEKITEDDPEWEEYNQYKWSASSKSFETVVESDFIIFADYWEEDLPAQRAVAYKVVSVESEKDQIKGETQWLKNNVVSVVLFSIAAVLLILIIILLLVKPSDETLEDIDGRAAALKKGEKAKDKKKKK